MLPRRRLLGFSLAGLVGATWPRRLEAVARAEDDPWLEALAALSHSTFLDIRGFLPDGTPFRKVENVRRAMVEGHGVPAAQVGVAFGAGSGAIAYVLNAAVWSRYPVGAKVAGAARDEAEAASLRTEGAKWTAAHAREVAAMVATGVRVLACRNTLARWARDFAAVHGESADTVNAFLLDNLHPGVEPVPAMIAAASLAQRRGVSYVAIG
jgi:hypothetical protein